jgi:hypothetical protein
MKLRLLIISIFISAVQSCFWMHEDVNCQATGYINVINKKEVKLTIRLKRRSEPKSSTIDHFSNDFFDLLKNESHIDTVFYRWTGTDKCVLNCNKDYGMDSFIITAFNNDSIVYEKTIFPCDSAKQFMRDTCENCMMIFYDTIIIK